jgi:fructose-1,6-bisphosphatase
MDHKLCTACGQRQPRTAFYPDARNKTTGLYARCKTCHLAYCKHYVYKVQACLYQKKYYAEHRAYYQEWRDRHREMTNAKRRITKLTSTVIS